MLRQLARLTRSVPSLRPDALALAVYADGADVTVAAADRGAEGVACVDDAARAVVVLTRLWQKTHLPWLRAWSEGFLSFVLAMQDESGWWLNFISDWDGVRNVDGPTSYSGGRFWHARALHSVSVAAVVLDSSAALQAAARGVERSCEGDAEPDVRAVELEAGLVLAAGGIASAPGSTTLNRWADELVAVRDGDVLLNWNGEQSRPHLWGHVQEGVLARAATHLRRPDLLAAARRSADSFITPLVEEGFPLPTVQPYGVASLVFSLDRLARHDVRYASQARAAREWFDGRNPSGRAVYDRVSGRVGDGVDHGRINPHSGAESNVCAAGALLGEAARVASSAGPEGLIPVSGWPGSEVQRRC